MAASKMNREDAQEWLESLQQVGEGWWRQVGLAVRANAHKALGMERREFAAQIGQRLIDPDEAIVELYKQGQSREAITDILGVSQERVAKTLYAEGLIQELPAYADRGKYPDRTRTRGKTHSRTVDSSGKTGSRTVDSTAEDLDEALTERDQRIAELEDQLDVAIKAGRNQAKDQIKDLKDKIAEQRSAMRRLGKELEQAREQGKSEQQLLREQKEREAAVAAIEAKFTPMLVAGVINLFRSVRDQMKDLVAAEGITEKQYNQIVSAYDAIGVELEVLAAKIGVNA